jgi:hypothetical protein
MLRRLTGLRRLVFGAGVALTIVTAHGSGASASWCWIDPEVTIATPAGNTAVVHLTMAAPDVKYAPNLDAATISYRVLSEDRKDLTARVVMSVAVPDDYVTGDEFPVQFIVSSEPWGAGRVYAAAMGRSGETTSLSFTVPTTQRSPASSRRPRD